MGNRKFYSLFTIHHSLFYLLLFTSALFSGCATSDFGIATTSEVGRLEWTLNELKKEVNAINKKTEAIEKQLPDQKGELNEKVRGVEESQKATARAVSDLLIKTQSLTKDVQSLTGTIEEVQYSSERSLKESKNNSEIVAKQVNELKLAVDDAAKRVGQLEQSFALLEKKKEESVDETKKEESEKAAKSDVKDVYMAAYEAYKVGRTKEARDMFASFLKDYPENEYSDNARFWIAESYYKDKNYEDAILAYEDLFRKNPDSDKIPAAMLKQGLAFYELKDKKTGRLILERLIENFPDSEQAKSARKKLSGS